MLQIVPSGVIVFPGSGITGNLADKAKRLASPFSITGRAARKLSPGMAVTVEVLTGKRRALDYILSPLREVASSSGHER